MGTETKICQNCKQDFIIEPDDFSFYEKMGVCPPDLCVQCRAQLRLSFRNERSFYKRPCDKCKKDIIAMYPPNKSFKVWCYDCWFNNDWEAGDYGMEYDFQKPFLEQFRKLWARVPRIALIYMRSPDSEYTNISADNKNCYFVIESSNNENAIHSYWVQECRDIIDTSFASKCELTYESDDCFNSYNILYSKGCHDCTTSYFLTDCYACTDCIGCVNLRHKSNYIFNKQYSKEEYEKMKKDFTLEKYSKVEELREKYQKFLTGQPRKFAEITQTSNSTGNYIKNAKNCRFCFHCYDAEDNKYGVHIWRNAKDTMDCDTAGRNVSLMYNSINSGIDNSNFICGVVCWTCTYIEYSMYCFNSNYLFGCIGMRKKNYCILNKQYDKKTYNEITNHIRDELKEKGKYGNFFPKDLSYFSYNESSAFDQFPLTKKEATLQNFSWEDFQRGTYNKETIKWNKISDNISETDFDVTKEIFVCKSCHKNYRIIENEFSFYKKLKIPLPRLCPDCRHFRRLKVRGPNKLWHRKCQCAGIESDNSLYKNKTTHSLHNKQHCSNEFETSYSPERKEIVYCEKCYQQEIY